MPRNYVPVALTAKNVLTIDSPGSYRDRGFISGDLMNKIPVVKNML